MAANPQLVLTSDKATVRQGNLLTISLQVKAAGIQAAAFSANVEISTEHFIVGKVISNLENVYYGDERKNQILLNWYADENVTFVEENKGELTKITLVPYGCTNLKVAVFPKYSESF